MLKTRILTAIIGIPLLIFTFYYGSWVFLLTVTLIALMMNYELSNMLAMSQIKYYFKTTSAFIILLMLNAFFANGDGLGLLMAAMIIFIFALLAVKYPDIALQDCFASVSGVCYIGLMMSYLIQIREFNQGFIFILFLFICIWCSDSGAYFSGKAFGKHPLAPKVSPKKTIEGLLGGLLFSIICGVAFYYIIDITSLINFIVISVLMSLVGVIGDLAESAIKRYLHVKDSGNLIPGHGGFMDRFDSVVFNAPLLYYCLLFIV